ncbi:MAG: molybdopterin cofactor-binding domain-containing protein [Gemmatimonadota bacterium]
MSGLEVSRREFVKLGGLAGAGLVLGVELSGCTQGDAETARGEGGGETASLNAWIRISPDGSLTVVVDRSEMGQGISTAISMLVAEELDADWEKVRFEFAPADPVYNNRLFHSQVTGGSTSIRAGFEPLRQAGAVARAMLVAAAAAGWSVPAEECRTENGEVIHSASGRRAGYGELAEAAAALEVPGNVEVKDPSRFRLVGTPRPRLDTPFKVDGTATFGIDVRRDGMGIAVVARSPVFGGRAIRYDDTAARRVPGVRDVVPVSSGVAVVADHYWAAHQGRQALEIVWDEGANAELSSETISAKLEAWAGESGTVAREEGEARAAWARASRRLEAAYRLPYLAHATMEPMNCTADVRPDRCDVWAPTQSQSGTQRTAARITGLDPDRISVHTTYLGGGFGRRSEVDFVEDAVEASKAVGTPVKVVYSREDDVRHDFYRPASHHRLWGGLGADGVPVAWHHRLVVQSILERFGPLRNGVDSEAVGGAVGLPYEIDNVLVEFRKADLGIPVGWWRSVNHTFNAFVTEHFMDELAREGGQDPFELRYRLLAEHPRHRRVLELAADEAGWGGSLAEGRSRGLALHESFGTIVAEVAEVSLDRGRPRVHRVVCAVDCGTVVNPSTIEAQIQSAVVYGLTAALYGEISIERGRVRQSNFHDYLMVRMREAPEIQVHLVRNGDKPGGIGEPGTPPIAPAVANALLALTGRPQPKLPI